MLQYVSQSNYNAFYSLCVYEKPKTVKEVNDKNDMDDA